jgi:hypothetical protein
MEKVVGSQDEQQGNRSDSYLADSSHDKWPGSLFEQILEVCTQAYAGKGEQEGPAAQVP